MVLFFFLHFTVLKKTCKFVKRNKMDKKILIKEIDKYINLKKNKTISEYIVYYMINGQNIEALIAVGDQEKKLMVNEILLKHFMCENNINLGDISHQIEEIKL